MGISYRKKFGGKFSHHYLPPRYRSASHQTIPIRISALSKIPTIRLGVHERILTEIQANNTEVQCKWQRHKTVDNANGNRTKQLTHRTRAAYPYGTICDSIVVRRRLTFFYRLPIRSPCGRLYDEASRMHQIL